jgi:DNA-binding GntR family transcriptional regulator
MIKRQKGEQRPVENTFPAAEPQTVVERTYEQIKSLAISFELRPGDRLNEGQLSAQLGISRTPLREALNRLAADGFLTLSPGRGFFRRPLDPKEIFDLYELRLQIETAGARLAIDRASAAQLEGLAHFLEASSADRPERSIADLVDLDEAFHRRLMALSGNAEMLRVLDNVHGRIRFVRWIHMEGRRSHTQAEHKAILHALRNGHADHCVDLLRGHIGRRLEQVVEAVKEGYLRIYMPSNGAAPGGS